SSRCRRPACSPLFPYTTLFRSMETWLMARWLIRPQDGDVRLTLRAALHGPGAAGEFDRVLIDCPPRLTTACVNALACCDYILIRSEEHTSELQSKPNPVSRLLL